jgi:hypothetical protein
MAQEKRRIFTSKIFKSFFKPRDKPKMTTIKIDNIDYDTDKLSDEAKAQLASIQFCDQELARLQAQSAALQTARMAYAKALQSELPAMPASDTIKFN